MNEVKFKANKKDLEAISGQIQEATAALDTTDATAGQVLKVETPGEAPVWGEAGGGGGGGSLFVNITPVDNDLYRLSYKASEILKAFNSGAHISINYPRSYTEQGVQFNDIEVLTLMLYTTNPESRGFAFYHAPTGRRGYFAFSNDNDYPKGKIL